MLVYIPNADKKCSKYNLKKSLIIPNTQRYSSKRLDVMSAHFWTFLRLLRDFLTIYDVFIDKSDQDGFPSVTVVKYHLGDI